MPTSTLDALPVYPRGQAPVHLRSLTQLRRQMRLQLAPGQRPACYVLPWYHPDEPCPLYDPADAVPLPAQSLGGAWVWRARRTCPRCGEQREYIVRGPQCGACRQAEQERLRRLRERTCDECRRVGRKPYPQVREGWYSKRLCRACTAARKRKLDVLLAEAVLCPGGCGKRTAAKSTVLDWALRGHRAVPSWPRVRCAPCGEAHRVEQERLDAEWRVRWERERAEEAERAARARESRRREVEALAAWAREALADPDAVILDTETTGLHEAARIVDIAVTTAAGDVLLDTLVNPGEPIPSGATEIHGITDGMLADAPAFGEVLPALEKALHGKRVLIYNRPYDVARLRHELTLLGYDPDAWLAGAAWEDAMIPYSDWVGEWSEWHGNNRWQPLNGGHRALGDCLAVIKRLREMAQPTADAVVNGGDFDAA